MPGVIAFARSAGGARPLVIAKHRTKAESDVAVSFGEAGPSWPRAMSTPSVVDTAVAMTAHEGRPPGITKQSATTKPENAESSGKAGSHWSRVCGTTETSRGTSSRKFRGWSSTSRVCEAQRHDRVRCWSAQDLVSKGRSRSSKIRLRSGLMLGRPVRS